MLTHLNTYADDLYPLISKRFEDRLENRTDLIKALIGHESIKTIDKRFEGLGGLGLIPKYDGTVIPELNSKRGFVTIMRPEEYAGKTTVEYKYAIVDMSGEAKKAGTRLATGLVQTQIRSFYNTFAKGFEVNDLFAAADGKALFATDHPINRDLDDTYSNLITLPFSVSAVTTAQTMAQRFKTYDGLDFDSNMDIVLISPELEPKARELFGADAKLMPETAENGANPVLGTKYFVIKGFTAKQWAVADSMLLKDHMMMVEITAPTVLKTTTDNPLIAAYTGYMDYMIGWTDARMIIGSNPA